MSVLVEAQTEDHVGRRFEVVIPPLDQVLAVHPAQVATQAASAAGLATLLVEINSIGRLKVSRLERFPFADLDANRAWMAVVCFGADLVRWFQLLCLAGPLAVAEPKALRWRLWHTPARLVHRARRQVVRILDGWPSEAEILAAYRRLALII